MPLCMYMLTSLSTTYLVLYYFQVLIPHAEQEKKNGHDKDKSGCKLGPFQRPFPGTELCPQLKACFQSPHLGLYFLEVEAATRRQRIIRHGDINSVRRERLMASDKAS